MQDHVHVATHLSVPPQPWHLQPSCLKVVPQVFFESNAFLKRILQDFSQCMLILFPAVSGESVNFCDWLHGGDLQSLSLVMR